RASDGGRVRRHHLTPVMIDRWSDRRDVDAGVFQLFRMFAILVGSAGTANSLGVRMLARHVSDPAVSPGSWCSAQCCPVGVACYRVPSIPHRAGSSDPTQDPFCCAVPLEPSACACSLLLSFALQRGASAGVSEQFPNENRGFHPPVCEVPTGTLFAVCHC